MADRKISELTNITGANLADADEFVVVDASASETKAITRAELLSNIVTSSTVTAAGALMDSELTDIAAVKALDQGVATTDSPTFNVVTATSFSGDGSSLTGIEASELAAIAASKGVTAVDVFIYDTSKDSDGGAWRKRTQHTSWYNETLNTATRGSRREFPAVAVIVAESDTFTIYDGDDPSLPMWMVQPLDVGRVASSVSALNGKVVVGVNAGVSRYDFIANTAKRINNGGREHFLNFETGVLEYFVDGFTGIVDNTVNDVAMTVLPDAPIDPATGLPVPVIAVATAGGVSVIKDDGTVVDSAYTGAANSISFTDDNGLLFALHGAASNSSLFLASGGVFTSDGWASTTIGGNTGLNGFPLLGTTANDSLFSAGTAKMAQAGGLSKILWNSTENQSLLNYTTSTYNTGWMPGDIKGALLSDTDDTDLVGSTPLSDDFSYADAAAMVAGGWVVNSGSIGDANNWTVDGAGNATITSAFSNILLSNSVLTTGKTYVVTIVFSAVSAGFFNIYANGGQINPSGITAAGTYTYTFVAAGTYIQILAATGSSGAVSSIDIKLADADRSVNNNGLIVNGTVTRTPVATGADLVAYSGFSASNYLEQPYNADLDFGTGDFCVMGWITESASSDWIVDRMEGRDGSSNIWGFNVWQLTSSPRFDVYENNANTTVTATTVMASGVWYFFTAVRRSGVLEMYMQGNLEATTSGTARNISYTSTGNPPPLTIGARNDGSAPWLNGNAALIRISATAPTAEQIKKIYEDEKVLFQENAGAVLAGTSDAVTALAYDDETQELLVGTSQNTSVFRGLRRVETIAGSASAISASNGLRVIED